MKALLVRKYSISEDDYRMMEVAIIENKPHKAGPQWKFAGAFYFSTVVLAMIGKLFKYFIKENIMITVVYFFSCRI